MALMGGGSSSFSASRSRLESSKSGYHVAWREIPTSSMNYLYVYGCVKVIEVIYIYIYIIKNIIYIYIYATKIFMGYSYKHACFVFHDIQMVHHPEIFKMNM